MRGIFFWLLTVFQAIIPVFIRKVVAQKKICDTKNLVRLQHPWKSENHAVRNRFHLRNGLRKRNLRNRKKQASNTLGEGHLKELTSWIFSRQKANEIEGIVCSNLFESPRVKSTKDRERFAKYLLCEITKLKTNFQLPILGFCRKFSTLVSECALSTDMVNKKAAISVAWMKMLGNFKSERPLKSDW